ncbi:hypothetical protein Pmani_025769 [Petrolisthes manimaculis]|uniref:Uncharacterized protein n=1 Tax=Petrolisthes manimaculis TaxID=1843537 RepID=A0AAE1U0U4_9EUCA|nr:hypothetical protein Pmani_025769 [Petrolisthes manimaculis]
MARGATNLQPNSKDRQVSGDLPLPGRRQNRWRLVAGRAQPCPAHSSRHTSTGVYSSGPSCSGGRVHPTRPHRLFTVDMQGSGCLSVGEEPDRDD